MKSLFVGYSTPEALDIKWRKVLPTLDAAGFQRIEVDGDVMHLIPDDREEEAVALVLSANQEMEGEESCVTADIRPWPDKE